METTPVSLAPGSSLWQLERVAKSDAFVRDARRLVAIPDTAFSDAIAALDAAKGFMTTTALSASNAAHVSDREQSNALTTFLFNLTELRRQASPDERFSERAASIIESAVAKSLEAGELKTLVSRLPALLVSRPPLERQLKAEEVARRTGTVLEALHLVCDIRPLFNDAGTSIEGLIPVTTLRIEYDVSGTSHAADIRLSASQVEELAQDVERALVKLKALRAFVRSSGLPIIDTDASEEGDAS